MTACRCNKPRPTPKSALHAWHSVAERLGCLLINPNPKVPTMQATVWRVLSQLTLVAMCCLSLTVPAKAQTLEAAKRSDIEQLLTVTRATEAAKSNMLQVSGQILQQQRRQNPSITDAHAKAVQGAVEAVVDENLGVLSELFVQLYHRHFTADELRQLLSFYQSPIGARLLEITPALNYEALDAGMQFGRILSPKIQQRTQEALKAQGLKL